MPKPMNQAAQIKQHAKHWALLGVAFVGAVYGGYHLRNKMFPPIKAARTETKRDMNNWMHESQTTVIIETE
jgi:hypothetical protein